MIRRRRASVVLVPWPRSKLVESVQHEANLSESDQRTTCRCFDICCVPLQDIPGAARDKFVAGLTAEEIRTAKGSMYDSLQRVFMDIAAAVAANPHGFSAPTSPAWPRKRS